MPKDLEISVLYKNYDLVKSVPSTYDEIDVLMGEVGAGLEGWLSDCSARNFLPRVYEDAAKKLTELGHPHKVVGQKKSKKQDGTETVTDVYETDIVHVERVRFDGDDELKFKVGELVKISFDTLPFWAKRAGGGAGKIASDAIELANKYFADGTEKVERVAAFIEGKVPGYKVMRDASGSPTPEHLARAIMALNKKGEEDRRKEQEATLEALEA